MDILIGVIVILGQKYNLRSIRSQLPYREIMTTPCAHSPAPNHESVHSMKTVVQKGDTKGQRICESGTIAVGSILERYGDISVVAA
jgi:hypothetical protein